MSVYPPPPSPPQHCRLVCTDWSGDHYTIDVWRTEGPYPHIRIRVYKQNVHTRQPRQWTVIALNRAICTTLRLSHYLLHILQIIHFSCYGLGCLFNQNNLWALKWNEEWKKNSCYAQGFEGLLIQRYIRPWLSLILQTSYSDCDQAKINCLTFPSPSVCRKNSHTFSGL